MSCREYEAFDVSPLRSGLIAAIATLVLDQASKLWLLNVFELGRRGAVTVTSFFDLVLAWNTGISYGWFQDSGPLGQAILLAIKVVAVIVLAVWMARSGTRLAVIGLGLIIGGAIGNGDRPAGLWRRGRFCLVSHRDRRKNYNWYVFNLADVAIVAGVAALLYDSFVSPSAAKTPS